MRHHGVLARQAFMPMLALLLVIVGIAPAAWAAGESGEPLSVQGSDTAYAATLSIDDAGIQAKLAAMPEDAAALVKMGGSTVIPKQVLSAVAGTGKTVCFLQDKPGTSINQRVKAPDGSHHEISSKKRCYAVIIKGSSLGKSQGDLDIGAIVADGWGMGTFSFKPAAGANDRSYAHVRFNNEAWPSSTRIRIESDILETASNPKCYCVSKGKPVAKSVELTQVNDAYGSFWEYPAQACQALFLVDGTMNGKRDISKFEGLATFAKGSTIRWGKDDDGEKDYASYGFTTYNGKAKIPRYVQLDSTYVPGELPELRKLLKAGKDFRITGYKNNEIGRAHV